MKTDKPKEVLFATLKHKGKITDLSKYIDKDKSILSIAGKGFKGKLKSNVLIVYCENNKLKKLKLPNAIIIRCKNNNIKKIKLLESIESNELF